MTIQFTPARKAQAHARVALVGPAGSGKTWTALTIAAGLGKRIAVIDTERGSASKYADDFDFDTLQLDTFSPDTYTQAIQAAEAAGYDVIVIDSLSHAWTGKEGALEQVDKAAARSQSKNTYFAWRDVTPKHNALIDAMIGARCHIVATMRAKTEYVIETDSKGKQVPRKIGLAAVQREGMEYEFDIVADMDMDHNFIVTKSRCRALADAVIARPDAKLPAAILAWLSDGQPETITDLERHELEQAVPGHPAVTTEIPAPAVTNPLDQELGRPPITPSNGNGRPKAKFVGDLAKALRGPWQELAALCPRYAKVDRTPDPAKILAAAIDEGYPEVTGTNWPKVRQALIDRTRREAAPAVETH